MTATAALPLPPRLAHRPPVGLTVYGCAPAEAALFRELAPRHGVVPALVGAPLALVGDAVLPAPGNASVSVEHTSEVTAAMLGALHRAGVRHVATRSIGVDHIDQAAAREHGIAVTNARYGPDGVADFTVMLILMAVRHAGNAIRATTRRDLRLGGRRDAELRELTVGVVGAGRIGAAVVERLRGFGCRVVAHDPGGTSRAAERVGLAELLRSSDVVTLHAPLSAATRHLIGRAELAAMKPGAILVNTARGGLVDTVALLGALEAGHLGGAALDVIEGEDAGEGNPYLGLLRALPNVVVTPHTAYFTERALRDTVEETLVMAVELAR
ncbi:NAD(P)-dependent oxidoreductase [Pseudolysinimonas sp.]|uniref:NAD(P)-dependent oxidoreductase n=1 Tax=Pseudolysinimonas sp. TaxID=2680009 RepID=UPI003F7F1B23